MRNAFAAELTKIAEGDERVVLLTGDIGNKLFDNFKKVDARRFYNCGVAEANMIGVASGMALSGLRPVVYTITPFTTTRVFEQIRVDVCYHNVPVVIVGTGAGLSYADLGPTHHSLEDLALLRTLPGMRVFAPCDSTELRLLLRAILKENFPAYIRIGKKGEPAIYDREPEIRIGSATVIAQGSDVCLLGAGTIMNEVVQAGELLAAQGISAEIASFHTVKPLDEDYLTSAQKRFKLMVTVEEHGRAGGFGGAVAEWSVDKGRCIPILSLGTPDEFMHEVGTQEYARKKYGLDASGIAARVSAAFRDA